MMEKTRLQDMIIGILTVAVGIWAWANTQGMPETTRHYTLCVIALFTLLGGILIIQSAVKRKVPAPGGETVQIKSFVSPLIALVLIASYALLLDKIGFFVTSAVFMVAMMLFLGYRKIVHMAITVLGMLGFIYALFVFQLHVALPAGILF